MKENIADTMVREGGIAQSSTAFRLAEKGKRGIRLFLESSYSVHGPITVA